MRSILISMPKGPSSAFIWSLWRH